MREPETTSTPRWEWRAFGSDLSSIGERMGAPRAVPPRSEEIYLLNSATPHSAKIRDGALEVKRLLRVDFHGLELWTPAFRGALPLTRRQIAEASAALALAPPARLAESYDAEALLCDIVASCEALRPVAVRKARIRFSCAGCAAEFVRLQVAAVPLESVAIESEDPFPMLAALRELRLDPRLNVSFPKGLERALALVAG
jgi:hypothetical protein